MVRAPVCGTGGRGFKTLRSPHNTSPKLRIIFYPRLQYYFLLRFHIILHMYYVYILQSLKTPGAIYIGYTSDLKQRLGNHNNSYGVYSRRHTPWKIETYIAFGEEIQAKNFEKYLKVGSGNAFLKKRLISKEFKKVLAEYNNGRMANST